MIYTYTGVFFWFYGSFFFGIHIAKLITWLMEVIDNWAEDRARNKISQAIFDYEAPRMGLQDGLVTIAKIMRPKKLFFDGVLVWDSEDRRD